MKQQYFDIDGYKTVNDDISSKVIEYDNNSSFVCCYSSKKTKKDRFAREEKLEKILKKEGHCLKSLLPSKHDNPYIKIDSKSNFTICYH